MVHDPRVAGKIIPGQPPKKLPNSTELLPNRPMNMSTKHESGSAQFLYFRLGHKSRNRGAHSPVRFHLLGNWKGGSRMDNGFRFSGGMSVGLKLCGDKVLFPVKYPTIK